MSSRIDLAVSNAALAPAGNADTRAQALRAMFGPHAARAAVRFAMEAQEMGEEDAALLWMQTAAQLADEDDYAASPFLH